MTTLAGNLERMYREYRRTVRRVRALQDVLLPEVDATLNEVESRLEELEQDERFGASHSVARARGSAGHFA